MTASAHSAPATSLPALEEVLPLARALARKYAHRDSDIDDLVQHALIKYHRELEKRSNTLIRKPWSMARTVLYKAMITYYYYSYPSKNKSYKLNTLEFQRYHNAEELVAAPKAPKALCDEQQEANMFDQFDLDDYFRSLEKECGKTARVLAENLISPKDPCITSYILWRSEDRPRSGSKSRSIRITQSAICEAMGLAPHQRSRYIDQIKQFTLTWLQRNGSLRQECRN